MAKQTINIGTTPNDGTGTPLRDAFDICNDNFTEIYGDDFVTNTRLANMTRGTIKVGGASDAPTDLDAKGNAKILIGDGTDLVSVPISGDISIDNTGNVTISDTAVENIMLGDDAVGADELASNAVVTASIQDDAVTPAKINILDDSLAATNAHIMVGDGTDFGNVAVSGDIGIDNTGATTIQTGAVENSMIGADAVNGDKIADDSINSEHFVDGSIDTAHIGDDQVTPAKINILDDSLAATDGHIMVGDGTDFGNVAMSGDGTITNAGVLDIITDNLDELTGHFDKETRIVISHYNQNTAFFNSAARSKSIEVGNFLDQLVETKAATSDQSDGSLATDSYSVTPPGGGGGQTVYYKGLKIADDGIQHKHVGVEFSEKDANATLSSGSASKVIDASTNAVYEVTLPGDGTNITLNLDNFKTGMTKLIMINTNASTAHTGTITFDQTGSGANTLTRISPQDIDQSANKNNFIFMTCIDETAGNSGQDRTFIYSVAVGQ